MGSSPRGSPAQWLDSPSIKDRTSGSYYIHHYTFLTHDPTEDASFAAAYQGTVCSTGRQGSVYNLMQRVSEHFPLHYAWEGSIVQLYIPRDV